MTVRRAIWLLPAALAVAGLAAMLVATAGAAWRPFVLGWAVVGLLAGWIELRARTKRTRVCVPLMAALVLPLFVFEGGFFVWPAAVALGVAAAVAPAPEDAPAGPQPGAAR
jgi:hypothetical protein